MLCLLFSLKLGYYSSLSSHRTALSSSELPRRTTVNYLQCLSFIPFAVFTRLFVRMAELTFTDGSHSRTAMLARVLAVIACLYSVCACECPSHRHTPVLYRNGCTE